MKDKIKKITNKCMLSIVTIMLILTSFNFTVAYAASEKPYFEVNKADEVITEAKKHIGKPYIWGAAGPDSFDCSGFASYVFKQVGLKFNADRFTTYSIESYLDGLSVTSYRYESSEASPAGAKKGDLILYYDSAGEPIHMGIYMGNGQIIHCAANMPSGPQDQVMISNVDALGTKHGSSLVTYRTFRTFAENGGVRLKKTDEYGNGLAGVTFKITTPNGSVRNVTTGKNGSWDSDEEGVALKEGTYHYQEISTVEGYILDNTVRTFQVIAGVKASANIVSATNQEQKGKINLTKTFDTSQTDGKKGDAILSGNTYALYADETIKNIAGTMTHYQKGQLISSNKTDREGKISWDDLPLGKYFIKELAANDTTMLNPEVIRLELRYAGQTVEKSMIDTTVQNRVNMQKIQIFKSGQGQGTSGIVDGLQGAEFTWKLKSEVDRVGWNDSETYAVIETDKNGKANTPYLPYGTYQVKETKTPKDYVTAPDFIVSVSEDHTKYPDIEQVKKININNAPYKSQLKLIKKDMDTGKRITLDSASFKIKNSKGEYVEQKVAGKRYDVFTTNSQNQVVPFFEKGTVMLPLALGADTYTIEEIKVPDGFLALERPLTFTITNQYDYDVDEDDEPVMEVIVKNEQPKGKIVLSKSDKQTGSPLENVEYTLTAKEDILNKIDGTLHYHKGQAVTAGKTDRNGTLCIDDLYMGHYELTETLTNEGYVLNEETQDIVFLQEDETTKEYVHEIQVTNIKPTGEIHLTKLDVDTSELLGGVIYRLTAKEDIISMDGHNTIYYHAGDPVNVDISEDGRYMSNELGEIHITGLPLGQYELKEVKQLDGYYSSDTVYDVDLSYDHSEKVVYVKNIEMYNTKTKTEIYKMDMKRRMLKGAKLSLYDNEGNLVESWTSEEQAHTIRGLLLNKTYRLHEDEAPADYEKAEDISFTLDDTGKPTILIIRDQKKIQPVKTGDDTMTLAMIAVILGAGIAAFILYRKSRKQ